jgi:hypothetical protein
MEALSRIHISPAEPGYTTENIFLILDNYLLICLLSKTKGKKYSRYIKNYFAFSLDTKIKSKCQIIFFYLIRWLHPSVGEMSFKTCSFHILKII